jgi:DNA-directed RNA polymerase subunit M/transcription elongation factor TFIIS
MKATMSVQFKSASSLGSLFCPICGGMFSLQTSNSSTSACPCCSTLVYPNTGRDAGGLTSGDIRKAEGMVSSMLAANGAVTIGKQAAGDNRVVEDALCEKCGKFRPCHTYARQTRGADEGQTIFYECTVCKSEWSLNS